MKVNRFFIDTELVNSIIDINGPWPIIEKNGKFYLKETGEELIVKNLNEFLKEDKNEMP